MPVHIKGGGGAGFPQGWKENFKGVVHEAAIMKGDPVVTGVYSDLENGMDVRQLPELSTYFNTYPALSSDGEMFVIYNAGTAGAAASSKVVNVWDDSLLAYKEVDLPVGTTAYYTKIGAAFSPDDKYLFLTVSTGSTVNGDTYLKIYRIDGVGANRTFHFILEQMLSGYASSSCVDFFNYLGDATKLRALVKAFSSTAYYTFLVRYDTDTQLFSYVNTNLANNGFVKIDEYSFIAFAAGSNNDSNRRRFFDAANDIVFPTYDAAVNKYLYTQGNNANVLAISDDTAYAIIYTSSNPYMLFVKNDGNFNWSLLANPDVLPTSGLNYAAFSPGGTYLAIGINASPWLMIYKKVGDTLVKVANPIVMPTKNCYGIEFSDDGKFLFVCQGNAYSAIGVFCYGFEAGNLVSKITSFSANPLSWLPAGRKKFGVALDSGAIGEEVRVNLFPVLNNLNQ